MVWAASESRDNSSRSGGEGPNFPTEIGESAQADAPRPEPTPTETSPAAAAPTASPTATPAVPTPSVPGAAEPGPAHAAAGPLIDVQVGQLGLALPPLVLESRPAPAVAVSVDLGGLNLSLGP